MIAASSRAVNRQAAEVRGVFRSRRAQPGFGHGPLAYAGTMMGRRAYLFLLTVVAVVVAAACSTSTSSTTGTSSATSTRIEVAPAYTPVVVAQLGAPTFPFKGSDGKFHIAYDLGLTNAASIPATIESIDVVDADNRDRVLASLSSKVLVDPACT